MGINTNYVEEISTAISNYNSKLERPIQLKAIFFDMDGVLFDSMPYHAKSWAQAFAENGLNMPEFELYINEGSTAYYTIAKMFSKYKQCEISEEETERIKARKYEIMQAMPQPEVMSHMPELLNQISSQNIDCWVVTGSAQSSLSNRLEKVYNDCFKREKMITANDVKKGKPNPEPYLKAMRKSGYQLHEAIVIENAPLGVESAKAAGLFTIAINTGPIDPNTLVEAGADIVLPNSESLKNLWPSIYKLLTNKELVLSV